MATFKDANERTWLVEINVNQARAVRSALGIYIPDLVHDKLEPLGKLLADPVAFIDVLYVLCRDQATREGISDEQFGRGMFGNVLGNAMDAFCEAFIDFFPSPETRSAIRQLLATGKKLTEAAMAEVNRELEAIDIQKMIESLSRELSTDSPGSSA